MRQHPLDSQYTHLRLSFVGDHVAIVELNRPKKRNAISAALWKEIGDVFRKIGTLGDGCRAVVLTGSGKSFSSGLDIMDSGLLPPSDSKYDPARRGISFLPQIKVLRQELYFVQCSSLLLANNVFDTLFAQEMQRCFSAVEECSVPVIAAIHGNCIGAGVDLACCCDIRICQPNTTFSVREVKIGLAADIGTLQRLPKITGNDSRVRELCFTGGDFGSEEALRIGFVSRTMNNALEGATELASKIAKNSPVASSLTKKSLVYSRDVSVKMGLDDIANKNALALQTRDLRIAATAAFVGQDPTYEDVPLYSRL